jgi:hypothetical protein
MPSFRRERQIAIAAAVALVLLRSFVYLRWEQSAFDSDQAIIGLMALHISQLRAFPVFMYGFNYLLAIEGYLAAPVFAVVGPSVAALRLPLVAVNIAVAILLILRLERDVKLRPALALAASSFFILTAPGTASQLVEANGGNPEPFLYILLLWITWNRPLLFGAILGIGFLHREFTAYGLFALLVIEAFSGTLFTRQRLRTLAYSSVAFAGVCAIVYGLHPFSDAAGPGAGPRWIMGATNNLQTLTSRFCFGAPAAVFAGIGGLFTGYLGLLFGAVDVPVVDLGVNSGIHQGLAGIWPIAAGTLLAGLGRVAWISFVRRDAPWNSDLRFCSYLFLVGLQSALFYVVTRCGALSIGNMRYTLLALLMGVGLSAAWLRLEENFAFRAVAIAAIALLASLNLESNVRLINEYVRHTPPSYRRPVADYLVSHGIRYARSDYWTAYHVTFLAGEQVIVSSDGTPRILEYEWTVEKHPGETVRISRTPCQDGTAIVPGVYYLCR